MDTIEKAVLAKAAAIFRLTQQGWNVSAPISEHAPYDLIAEKNGMCKRVQVKHASNHGTHLDVSLKSVTVNCSETKVRLRQVGDWDAIAIFDPVTTNVYFLLDSDSNNKNEIRLRLVESRQIKNVKYARDYLLLK